MKRKIKIEASFSGVLPTGSYANMRPGFAASMEFEADFQTDGEVSMAIECAQAELQGICYESFEREAEKAKIAKVKNDLKNFRFYKDHETDQEYPSVTSICNYDKDFHVSDYDLLIYAAQGNLIDAEFRNYAKTGVFKPSSELLECTADRFILKSRKLSTGKYLALDGWDIPAFAEKFAITEMKSCDTPVINKKYRYAGTPDILCLMDGKKTMLSIKRTYVETENFVQDSAYCKCDGVDVEQIAVAEFKPEADGGNKQGFSKPRITTEIDKYFEIFLRRRSEVLKIYGV